MYNVKPQSILTEQKEKYSDSNQLKVCIYPEAHQRLTTYLSNCETEISGVGTAIPHPDIPNAVLITEVFLLEQDVTTAHTEIPAGPLTELITTMIQDGKNPGELRFWWHSHGHMRPFWSEEDEETIAQLNDSWAIALVGNTECKSFKVRVDLYTPFKGSIEMSEVEVYYPGHATLVEELRQEITEKVTRTFTPGKVLPGSKVYKSAAAAHFEAMHGIPKPDWEDPFMYSEEGYDYRHMQE